IRATAIGASLFTSQVGINLFVSNEAILPLGNVPVLTPGLQLGGEVDAAEVAAAIHASAVRADIEQGERPMAVAFRLVEDLPPESVRALAEGISEALAPTIAAELPFIVMVDEAIASS